MCCKYWGDAVDKLVPLPNESLGPSWWYDSSKTSPGKPSDSSSSSEDSSDDDFDAFNNQFGLSGTRLCTLCARFLLWQITIFQAAWKRAQKDLSLVRNLPLPLLQSPLY